MRVRPLKLLVFIIAIAPIVLLGQTNNTAPDLLRQPIDPMSVGRGGTGTANATGLTSVTLNPAHINRILQWESFYNLETFGNELNLGQSYFMTGAAYQTSQGHNFGLFLRRFNFGEFVRTGPRGEILGTSSQYEMSIGAMYGRKFGEQLEAGVHLKFLRYVVGELEDGAGNLFSIADNGWAADIGATYRGLFPQLTKSLNLPVNPELEDLRKWKGSRGLDIGITLLNAGPKLDFLDQNLEPPLPQSLRIGIAYHPIISPVFDVSLLFDYDKLLVSGFRHSLVDGITNPDPFYKAWFTGWTEENFSGSNYHFGTEINLFSVFLVQYGYLRASEQDRTNSLHTIGLGLETNFFTLHIAKWLDEYRYTASGTDAFVLGFSAGNIGL